MALSTATLNSLLYAHTGPLEQAFIFPHFFAFSALFAVPVPAASYTHHNFRVREDIPYYLIARSHTYFVAVRH